MAYPQDAPFFCATLAARKAFELTVTSLFRRYHAQAEAVSRLNCFYPMSA
ncbi:hypothetical protein PsAD2_00369 [Pseudovibrio axinellae]|uniref:Uncharacterized protein n=1 Tax=Pseudovibrio axinellae TaxID=989403 RepID=A0A161VC60_9HYPH|nr:hypothetical protein PsAD2_00369 [Pseudovibrio axinellae]SEQ21768.1 hypothetical protein SAMN05421798_102161 [Pseudovibrio axinellae]